MSYTTIIIAAVLFIGIGLVFGLALGFLLGFEVKTSIDKKRQS